MDTSPPSAEAAGPATPTRAGIEGWLAIFIVVHSVLLLALLVIAPFQFINLHDGLTVMAGWMPPPLGWPGIWERTLFGFGAFVWFTCGIACGLYLALRRRRSAPWFWRRFPALVLALAVVGLVWDLVLTVASGAPVGEEAWITQVVRVGLIAIMVASLLYWRRSRRVRETFGG